MGILNTLVAVCVAYVALLFVVAFWAEREAVRGRARWLRSPLVYTLALSIYCTGWTFYGAVGFAARSGLEFLTIYIGPTLVMLGWWWGLRKLVRIGRTQRITSIADLVSSRYGKSPLLAVFVTVIAVAGTTPYIALQLQSVVLSFGSFSAAAAETAAQTTAQTTSGAATIAGSAGPGVSGSGVPGSGVSGAGDLSDHNATALWIALGLALFTILFGTRNLDANERHHGVVMAVAMEAVVKLFALLAVGAFVVWELGGGVAATMARIDASPIGHWQPQNARWAALIMLSAAAFLTLPRMFQVLVVENEDEGHLRTAAWAFPTYLMLMSLFVVPIAVLGLDLLPAGSNPDQFVLTLPLSQGREGLAMLSFIGGFSSATSMVIVASLALATMVSNHIVMPIWLRLAEGGAMISGDVRQVVILSRRLSIGGVLALGYLYFRLSGGGAALSSIGLISFVGVAQVLPALMGGVFWRGANRLGAITGLSVGFVIWAYTMFLPSFGPGVFLPHAVFETGLFGNPWLQPQALFGITGLDPVVHSVLWSMSLNTGAFILVSLLTFPQPLERLQGAQFVNVFQHTGNPQGWSGGIAQSEDLMVMAQRILGPREAQMLFQNAAAAQGLAGYLPDPTPEFLQLLEREMSGSVGAATAHAMVSQIMGRATVSVEDLLAVADETAQMMEHQSQLEAKSAELTRTARQLRAANDKLTQLSVQKDAFLSQISHELRTPMTSIRSFSEILRDGEGLEQEQLSKYASIIHQEAIRLTRLLDDLLDLSVLENGQVSLNIQTGGLQGLIDHALASTGVEAKGLRIHTRGLELDVQLQTDLDRLSQVFINLIANAHKYCDAPRPALTIRAAQRDNHLVLDFTDNGSGVPREKQDLIFEKFARVSDQKAGGAGLGLAICREIMARLGGAISYLPGQGGASFRVTLPMRMRQAAE